MIRQPPRSQRLASNYDSSNTVLPKACSAGGNRKGGTIHKSSLVAAVLTTSGALSFATPADVQQLTDDVARLRDAVATNQRDS